VSGLQTSAGQQGGSFSINFANEDLASLLDPVFGRDQYLDWFNQSSFLSGQYD